MPDSTARLDACVDWSSIFVDKFLCKYDICEVSSWRPMVNELKFRLAAPACLVVSSKS